MQRRHRRIEMNWSHVFDRMYKKQFKERHPYIMYTFIHLCTSLAHFHRLSFIYLMGKKLKQVFFTDQFCRIREICRERKKCSSERTRSGLYRGYIKIPIFKAGSCWNMAPFLLTSSARFPSIASCIFRKIIGLCNWKDVMMHNCIPMPPNKQCII